MGTIKQNILKKIAEEWENAKPKSSVVSIQLDKMIEGLKKDDTNGTK